MTLLGYVLSGSTTSEAVFEPLESAENRVREGMIVVIRDSSRRILGTVTSIEVHNEFYEKGSVWSESIRRGKLPPSNVARRYMAASIQLQGEIMGSGLSSVARPPRPGSEVYEATPRDFAPLYGYEPRREKLPPSIVEIGSLYGYDSLPAVLDVDKMTMHMAVIGVTGSGKSNTIGVLIEELGSKQEVAVGGFTAKTIPLLVFDANGDYLDYYYSPEIVPSYRVIRFVSPSQYPRLGEAAGARLEEMVIDLNVFRDSPLELAEALYAYTRGGMTEGLELQIDLLSRVLLGALEDERARDECPAPGGVDLNCLLASRDGVSVLENILEEEKAHKSTAEAVRRTLHIFLDRARRSGIVDPAGRATFTEDLVDEIVSPESPGLVIVDFSAEGSPGIDLRTKQFIVYYVLRLLFNKFVEYRSNGKDRVMGVVIEEAQNYAPNQKEYPIGYSVARGVLATTATQGRKFGLSLVLVTQRPGFVDPVIMSMMNTFIVHRISPGDIRFVQAATGGLPRHIASKLSRLETGLAILVGQMNRFPYPLLARIRKRRKHLAGSI